MTTKGITCKVDEYQCKSLKCIKKTKVCNQNNDCPDNDDESSCCKYSALYKVIKTLLASCIKL